jgi:ABC-type glutathione transport system ATPase component
LEASGLTLYYPGLARPALDGVALTVRTGEVVGVVGESGSGKSSLARCLLGLEVPVAGAVCYKGQRVDRMDRVARKGFRRGLQLVFQDPYHSLNPRMRIGEMLDEIVRVHGLARGAERSRRIRTLLDQVGLPADTAARYPHEMSGGQRQRVGLARALAVDPELVIADEPVSALDVSVQAHLLNLLRQIVEQRGIALVLIAHDLAVVRYLCHRVAVMHEGRVVEQGTAAQMIDAPTHPYTRSLIAAVPDVPGAFGNPLQG